MISNLGKIKRKLLNSVDLFTFTFQSILQRGVIVMSYLIEGQSFLRKMPLDFVEISFSSFLMAHY